MGLLYWEALQRLNALHQEMYHLLHILLKTGCESMLWVNDTQTTQPTAIQVWETDTEIILQVEIPNGMAETLEVNLTEETVIIRGKQPTVREPQNYFDFEFYVGRFQSLIPLPTLIQPQTASARLQENLLTLTLQKSWRSRQSVSLQIADAAVSTGNPLEALR